MEPTEPNPCCKCSCCSIAKPRQLDGDEAVPVNALERAEAESELESLRETVASQQQTIQELCEDLDDERNAASSAASEAMSMILRLQREKAEVLMEARQFRRLAEEKFAHDQKEIEELEEELCQREEAIEALTRVVRELRERIADDTVDSDPGRSFEASAVGRGDEKGDIEMTPLEETLEASTNGGFENIESQSEDILETLARSGSEHVEPEICEDEVLEKEVVLGDSSPCVYNTEQEEIPVSLEGPAEGDADDSSDRVYTVDAVHVMPEASSGVQAGNPSGQRDFRIGEVEIMDLQRRVQALEAEGEMAKQAIVNMKAENMQLLLLREISRNLVKVMVQQAACDMARGQLVKERASARGLSFMSLFKWLMSLFFWKREAEPTQRLPVRTPNDHMSLYSLLGKSPIFQQLRCLPRTPGQGSS